MPNYIEIIRNISPPGQVEKTADKAPVICETLLKLVYFYF